tara:strand:- start:1308 stop:1628 length:321 start_codon:yes stop_codon:yes gene_type:complete
MSLNVGASTRIEYVVTNAVSGPVNDATVTVTILDNKGVEIPDETWPFNLPYVAASDGVYSNTFDPFTSLIAGQQYTVIIDVVGTDGLIDQCKVKSMATVKNCEGGC